MNKSELDEQINKKKSQIDEQLNKKKADADAEAARKKADAEAEAEAERKKADADALKMKDGAFPPKEGEQPPASAPPKQDAQPPAGETGGATPNPEEVGKPVDEMQNIRAAVENHDSRLARIEQMLDKIAQEEEQEHSTDASLTRAENKPEVGASGPGLDNSGVADTLAKMSKEIARQTRINEELVAKFSKFESVGMRRTISSGSASQSTENPEVSIVKGILGEVNER